MIQIVCNAELPTGNNHMPILVSHLVISLFFFSVAVLYLCGLTICYIIYGHLAASYVLQHMLQ